MNQPQLIIASTNQHKIIEFKQLVKLHQLNDAFFFLSLDEYLRKNQFDLTDVTEYGISYAENALIKAWQIATLCKSNVISDDSGIEIAHYDNKPGIYSRRWKAEMGTMKRNYYVVDEMTNQTKREAKYICAIAYVNYKNQSAHVFTGVCHGFIATKVDDTNKNAFGYDPIFICEKNQQYYSQLTLEQKNKISHRGIAFAKWAQWVKQH